LTTALEEGEGSASRPGRTLPSGKTRYPLYRRLGGHKDQSGQVRKISPPSSFDPRTGKFYYNSVEKIEIRLISDKNIRQFTAIFYCYLEEHRYVYMRHTALSKAKGVFCWVWESSDGWPCARSHPQS